MNGKYYVTYYNKYPIYEPAEGGYYYSGIEIVESHEFSTFKKAKLFLRKWYKNCIECEDHKSKYWRCNASKTFFGQPNQKYIGDGWYVQLERKQGKDVRGWTPYCQKGE